MSNINQSLTNSSEFASFGAVHLNTTSLKKSKVFWTKIAGMKLRKTSDTSAEFGTENKTLIVIHEAAKTPYKKGYSGLYHVAIHVPNKVEFANIVYRLIVKNHPFSPTDHTMSKSIYLDDPDGINIEFTLETPERFKRVITEGGLRMEGADGVVRAASERLDVEEVLKELKDKKVDKTIANGSYIGHLHLFANNIETSNAFYKKLGYKESNYLPEYMFADLGAGGAYTHRMVMNTWHGTNRPLAPKESSGMKYFQIIFNSEEALSQALSAIVDYKETDKGYWCTDPTGNNILLTH